jgi:hypothetical protein
LIIIFARSNSCRAGQERRGGGSKPRANNIPSNKNNQATKQQEQPSNKNNNNQEARSDGFVGATDLVGNSFQRLVGLLARI